MGSTLRNDTRHAVILSRIAKAWDKRADLTLMELLEGALGAASPALALSDDELAEKIERFVMFGP